MHKASLLVPNLQPNSTRITAFSAIPSAYTDYFNAYYIYNIIFPVDLRQWRLTYWLVLPGIVRSITNTGPSAGLTSSENLS
jgi:hypothetical protein